MKITTPYGTLEGESIKAILAKYGFDCLRGANLRGFDLHGADMTGADMTGAKLTGADLTDAILCRANLTGADLTDAILCRANLCRANLTGADLTDAILTDADLCRANLTDATHLGSAIARTSILPDEGDIIGWKKAYEADDTPVIVKLLIPADAQRSNSTGRKCRANKARILDLQDEQGDSFPPDTTAHSQYDSSFHYRKGETVNVENFDTNRWNECAPGIHFFITRIEAVEY